MLSAHSSKHYLRPPLPAICPFTSTSIIWIPLANSQQLSNLVYEVSTCASISHVFREVPRNPLTYRYTIGMVAWNVTPKAAAVNSGPVRKRLETSQTRGLELRTLKSVLESRFSYTEPDCSFSWVVLAPANNNHQDLLRFHKSSGGVVLLAQQSVLPNIPKSGLTALC